MRAKPILKIRRSTDTEVMAAQFVAGKDRAPANLDELGAASQPEEAGSENVLVGYRVGSIVDIPVQDIDDNRYGARVHYSVTEVDDMGQSLRENGQEVTAKGYVDGTKTILIDGQKRLRGARSAGLRTLRVEICEKPPTELDAYLASRRINSERSAQTALDDAVQWKLILDEHRISTASELAKKMGVSEAKISQTISLNRIPARVRQAMIQRPATSGLKIAYEISLLFSDGSDIEDRSEFERLVIELVEEIGEKELSVSQAKALLASRTSPPKSRARAVSVPFQYGGIKGQLKTFSNGGKLDLSIKGLPDDQLVALREQLLELVSGTS